ncbi:S9 family peptidase [Alkalicoccus luteus]|uniref:S9 family peptidase n=1 Tax=Alkalicoccus luteus TaxID=1237094 RepID=A0A969PPF2_9BACI|nr:S9 family peptidase [Alkalicoccus luteus]NJP36539.1 S9 family peptidase [Alkalicoccus luteus]
MKQPAGIQDLFRLSILENPQLSPDGASVLFVRRQLVEDRYTSQLFVQRLEEPEAVQWTFGSGTVSFPVWSQDGKQVAFIYRYPDEKQARICKIAADGGGIQEIQTLSAGAGSLRWTASDSELILTVTQLADEPDEKPNALQVDTLDYKSDKAGLHDGSYTQLAAMDPLTGKWTALTDSAVDKTLLDVSSDGSQMLFVANERGDGTQGSDVHLLDRKSGRTRVIVQGSYNSASFSPDEVHAALIGHDQTHRGAGQSHVSFYNMKEEKLITTVSSMDRSFTDTMIGDIRGPAADQRPVWTSQNAVCVPVSSWGNVNLVNVSFSGRIDYVTTGNHHVFDAAFHKDSGVMVAGISTPVCPGELFIVNEQRLSQLTSFQEGWKEQTALLSPEELTFERDGFQLQGWVLIPEQADGRGLLHIHGGPHAMYGNTFFHEMQVLAAEGTSVLFMNPRGSHGYGQSFVNAVRGNYGGGDFDDLMMFTDETLSKFPHIETGRLGVTGGSYGGFMTNWIVSHTNRFRAAATLRCISNWISFYGVSDIGYFFTDWEHGTVPPEGIDELWRISPLKYAEHIETPLLIMHGEEDLRCPMEQAEQLYIHLKRRNHPVSFIRFPQSNHELSRSGHPRLRRQRLTYLRDWFQEQL